MTLEQPLDIAEIIRDNISDGEKSRCITDVLINPKPDLKKPKSS